MLRKLPRDIRIHIAAFMPADLQACDPRCYRASRTVQAAWRGWITRFQRWRCNSCGERVFLGTYFNMGMFTCDTCRIVRNLYATAGDMDA